jgi:hypothetical protein
MKKLSFLLIRICQALVIATVLSAVMLSAHAATWFSCTGDTLSGNYITTIINGLKNYLQ